MAVASFLLDFDGYWVESNAWLIPERPGVYCVYACGHDLERGTVTIRCLIYIGGAVNAKERIASHERRPRWHRYLRQGEQLCYSFAPVEKAHLARVEAALVFHHEVRENERYCKSFAFEETEITTSGRNACLHKHFKVRGEPKGGPRKGLPFGIRWPR